MNTQTALGTAPDLCKNVLLAALFGSNGSSYTVSKQSDMCVCICTNVLHNIQKLVGQKKQKGNETAVNAACQFEHARHRFGSPGPDTKQISAY